MLDRIGLGTVQFGSHYGVTNHLGKPSRKECYKIIETAIEAGIICFDTAAYYGDADLILSSCLPRGMKVVTKIKTIDQGQQSYDLFGDNLYGVLSDRYMAIPPIKSGISIYWPTKIDPTAQLVQMPLNMADKRNLKLAKIYRNRGVEIHARSVFLQGLLLKKGATIRQCLKWVLDQPIDIALVGVNSVKELKDIITAVETLDEETGGEVPHIELLDPRTWGSHAHN